MNYREFTILIINEGQWIQQYNECNTTNTYLASTVTPNTVLEFKFSKLRNSPCSAEAHPIEIILSVISSSAEYSQSCRFHM